jgi:hypothetical protein
MLDLVLSSGKTAAEATFIEEIIVDTMGYANTRFFRIHFQGSQFLFHFSMIAFLVGTIMLRLMDGFFYGIYFFHCHFLETRNSGNYLLEAS